MIIDFVIIRANNYVQKFGKFPEKIVFREAGENFQRVFRKEAIGVCIKRLLDLDKRMDFKEGDDLKSLVNEAANTLFRSRRFTKLGFLNKPESGKPASLLSTLEIGDLRPNKTTINGAAYERLRCVINNVETPRDPELTHRILSTVKTIDLFIVETKEQSLLLQYFFARRGMLAMVATEEELAGIDYSVSNDTWTKPFAVSERAK